MVPEHNDTSSAASTEIPGDADSPFRAKQAAALPMWLERGAPVLDGYRHPDGAHIAVWCPHESRWHRHGICRQLDGCANREPPRNAWGNRWPGCTCPPGSGDGHRGAHCLCALSPLKATGYVIREIGALTPAVEAAHGPDRYARLAEGDAA